MMDLCTPGHRPHISWRLLRWFAMGLFVPLALTAMLLCAIVWRLAQAPLDVTSLAGHWQPLPIHIGAQQRPIAHIRWKSVHLGWTPHVQHTPAGMVLRAEAVELVQTDGRVMDRLDHVSAVLNLGALLRGHLAFRAVRVSGASFTLKHYEDGTIAPDIMGFSRTPPATQQGSSLSFLETDALRDIEVAHLSVTMEDVQRSTDVMHFHMPLLAVHYRHVSGWRGHLEGAFHWGSDDVPFQLTAEPRQHSKKTHLVLTIAPFIPARLAGWLPNVRADDVVRWQFPVHVRAEGDVQSEGMGGRPLNLSTSLFFGQGEFLQPDHEPLHIQEGQAQFAVRWRGTQPLQHVALEQGKIRLVMRDSQARLVPLTASSHIQIDDLMHPAVIDGEIHALMPGFDFATLGSVWPYGVMKGARRWMTANMTEGRGDTLTLDAHLQSSYGFQSLRVSRLEGHLKGHGLTVHWLRPVQPVTGLEATAHFLNPDAIQIDVAHGQLSDGHHATIAVPQGSIILSGILQKDQYAHIALGLDGAFPSFLNVLAHPRLHLLSSHPLGLDVPAGRIRGMLSVALPLDKHTQARDIAFGATAECRHVAFDSPDLGEVRDGNGQLTVMQQELRFEGKAQIRRVPVDLSVMESFLPNEPGRVLRAINAKTSVDSALLRTMGFPLPEGMMSGAARVRADYVQKGLGHAHRQGDAQIDVDLTSVALKTAAWTKKAGAPSALSGHLRALDTHIQALNHLTAYGPSLALSGIGQVKNNHVAGVQFSHVKVGRTEGRMQARWPVGVRDTAPYRVEIAANTLDLAPWVRPQKGMYPMPARPERTHRATALLPEGRWRVFLQADRVFYDQDHALTGVASEVSWGRSMLEQAHVQVAGPDPLTIQLEPLPGKVRSHRLSADISNLGALISEFGGYHQLQGGHAHVSGLFQGITHLHDASSRWSMGLGAFQGHVETQKLALLHPPAVLTAATVFEPFHWGEIARDRFEDMTGSALVSMAHHVMTIREGQLSNAILGATLEGKVDVAAKNLALKGTISPLFKLNHAAGTMFGMRSILAPEKGSGVMALTYSVDGPFEKPVFQTYPLSVFLPGMLRHILN